MIFILSVVATLTAAYANVSCFGLPGDHYRLCEAIKRENCINAGQAKYFLCLGALRNQCGMVSQNLQDYILCRGLVTGKCQSVDYLDRILCKKFE